MPVSNSPSRPSFSPLATEANVRLGASAPSDVDWPAAAGTALVLSGGTPHPGNGTNESIARAASARRYQEAVTEKFQKEGTRAKVDARLKEKAPGYDAMVAEYPNDSPGKILDRLFSENGAKVMVPHELEGGEIVIAFEPHFESASEHRQTTIKKQRDDHNGIPATINMGSEGNCHALITVVPRLAQGAESDPALPRATSAYEGVADGRFPTFPEATEGRNGADLVESGEIPHLMARWQRSSITPVTVAQGKVYKVSDSVLREWLPVVALFSANKGDIEYSIKNLSESMAKNTFKDDGSSITLEFSVQARAAAAERAKQAFEPTRTWAQNPGNSMSNAKVGITSSTGVGVHLQTAMILQLCALAKERGESSEPEDVFKKMDGFAANRLDIVSVRSLEHLILESGEFEFAGYVKGAPHYPGELPPSNPPRQFAPLPPTDKRSIEYHLANRTGHELMSTALNLKARIEEDDREKVHTTTKESKDKIAAADSLQVEINHGAETDGAIEQLKNTFAKLENRTHRAQIHLKTLQREGITANIPPMPWINEFPALQIYVRNLIAQDHKRTRSQSQEAKLCQSDVIAHKKQNLDPLGLKFQNLNSSELESLQTGPFFAGIYDSSNGGIIAAKNIGKMLSEISPNNVRMLLILDHGNAPYGSKSRAELIVLVRKALLLAKRLNLDAVVMACNTACTAFRTCPDDKEGIGLETIGIPIIDLISNTAKEIAKHGGKKPVLFSTEATAKDDVYETRIIEAAQDLGCERPDIKRISGGDQVNHPGRDLATLINDLHHKKDASIQDVKAKLKEFLAPVDEHDTSLWLVCTHYPEIKDLIYDELRARGLTKIHVFDPIYVQANALLPALSNRNQIDRSDRRSSTESIVITSGEQEAVRNSVEALYGESLPVLTTDSFKNFNKSLVDGLLYKNQEDVAIADDATEPGRIDYLDQSPASSALPQQRQPSP